MAKIVWTIEAIQERDSVFKYWNERNHSDRYSKKLRALIREALDTVRRHPQIGTPTPIDNIKDKNNKGLPFSLINCGQHSYYIGFLG